MILTKKQQEGLNTAVDRYKNKEAYTCIAGYAGTGKSTLISFIIEALNLKHKEVAYVAFTGKAANILSQKGCPNATTAHKLLYHSKPLPDGRYIHEPKTTLDYQYKLLVVDEISMLPKEMWELLLRHRIHIIACGDPEQLPPINPDMDNHVLDHPHVFLDEIMRQAAESEIIRLSMHVREGNPLETFQCDNQQVQVLTKNDVVTGMYEWADQIICATNNTRVNINNNMRKLRGFGDAPQENDKVISLSNHWDIFSAGHAPLTNGSIGYLKEFTVQSIYLPKYIYNGSLEVMIATVETEDKDIFTGLTLDYNFLMNNTKTLSPQQEYKLLKNKRYMDPPFDFTYGYAITCHKAQGSEWQKLLVFEEKFPFDKEEHRRWLYTAITRASEKLVIVKK